MKVTLLRSMTLVLRSGEASESLVTAVGQGSLHPALHRLEAQGWIASEWDASENNRRAKFYKLPKAEGGGRCSTD